MTPLIRVVIGRDRVAPIPGSPLGDRGAPAILLQIICN